jgi:PPM family protein phosphatase
MAQCADPGGALQIEYADVSDVGHREENQDRAAVAQGDSAALLLVLDGMGGHSDGARAAEIGRQVLLDAFAAQPKPLFDPLGFLHRMLGRAHEAVVAAGRSLPLEQRPRATCAVCLVQDASAYWAHLGDSRIYHIRNGALLERTRDHSHVEQLLRDGAIREDQVRSHPMRNFVECCIGGEPGLPEMSLSTRRPLAAGRRPAGLFRRLVGQPARCRDRGVRPAREPAAGKGPAGPRWPRRARLRSAQR